MASFSDDFGAGYTSAWVRSDGWGNGSPFNVGWRADHVLFATSDAPASGVMRLRLDNVRAGKYPYSSGEYRTADTVPYGTVRARMKPAKASGVVSSLFTYTGPSYNNDPWDEVDIEFLGKNTTQMQVNYFTDSVGGHEKLINLGFDASLAYHDYAFDWEPGSITWYVDGCPIHVEDGSRGALPTHPGRIFMNLWAGDRTTLSWLGQFAYSSPLYASYDSVGYGVSPPVPPASCPPPQ
jgi:beta-glucanase (GH16 family)